MEWLNAGMGMLASTGLTGQTTYTAREYSGLKRLYRVMGIDQYDDFEFMMVVHEVSYEYAKDPFTTQVCVKAGDHVVSTEESVSGDFQEPLTILVEQGTGMVTIELHDKTKHRVVSELTLEVTRDIVEASREGPIVQKLYTMAQRNKAVVNPRLRLSIEVPEEAAASASAPSAADGEAQGDDNFEEQHQEADFAPRPWEPAAALAASEEERRLMERLRGLVRLHHSESEPPETVLLGLAGPPRLKRFHLALWKDEEAFEQGDDFIDSVDFLKVRNVQSSSKGEQMFEINYAKTSATDRRQLLLEATDREREQWVEALVAFVELRHASKAQRANGKAAA